MSKIKNLAYIMIFLIVLFALAPKSEAAGLVIAFSKSTANVGDTVTVTVTGSGVTGKVNLSVSGNATLSQNSVWVDNNSTSVTATITGTGSIRITATAADMADSTTSDPYSGATAGTITVANSSSGTGSSGGTSNSGGSSNSGGTSSNGSTSTTKSSNANLSNLGIRPNDFSGFKPGTTSYTVTVPNDVSSVEIYASKGQSGQSISGTGNKTLQEGANTFKVVVTAEDGKTKKTYTLTINREAKSDTETPEETENTENTENPENTENGEQVEEENTEFGLKELSIEGITLSPEFKTDVYEYTAKLIGEATSLKLNTSATAENAKVEITGNENLQEGENIVTILVTNESGDETVAYQIKVTKSLVDEEALAKQREIEEQEKQRKIIIISAVVAAIIIIAIIIIIRHRRNKKLAEEYTVPFMNMNQYDDENNYDDTYSDDDDSYQKITNKFLHKENADLESTKDIPVIQDNYSVGNENASIEQNNIKEDNNTERNKMPEFTSTVDEEKDEKAKLREEYLNQSFETMEDFDKKPSRKRHSKGKRFKK